ncbi:MAG: CDP-alcohol phosphatidyltransferase family protein [Brevinematia bacterium]
MIYMQEQFRSKLILVNIFTLARVALFPVILVLVLSGGLVNILIAFFLFVIGALTDAFDGILARKYNVESKFGFIIDPIADKFLVLGTLLAISLVDYLMIPIWLFFVILFRDVIVSILKPISERWGFSIPTTLFAKVKTTVQFVGIILVFVYLIFVNLTVYSVSGNQLLSVEVFSLLPYYIVLFVAMVTIISGVEYLVLFVRGIRGVRNGGR